MTENQIVNSHFRPHVFLRSYNLRLSALQWFFWSGFGAVNGFLVAYLNNAGFDSLQVGFVLALFAGFAIIGQPAWGYFSDYTGRLIVTLLLTLAGGLLSLVIFYTFGRQNYVSILIATALFGFCLEPTTALIDTLTYKIMDHGQPINYGLTRAMGSVGFAITMALTGIILDAIGIIHMYAISFGMLSIALIVTFLILKDSRFVEHAKSYRFTSNTERKPISLLIKNKEISVFLIVNFLIFTAFRAAVIYMPLLIIELGGTNQHIGVASGVMAVSEVPVLILSTYLIKKFGDQTILLWSFGFFTLRIFLHLLVSSAWGVVFVQAAQGLSFGLYLPASVHFMYRVSPAGYKATAQALSVAVSFGLASVSGSFLGSLIISTTGIVSMYGYAGFLGMFSTLLYFAITKHKKGGLAKGT